MLEPWQEGKKNVRFNHLCIFPAPRALPSLWQLLSVWWTIKPFWASSLFFSSTNDRCTAFAVKNPTQRMGLAVPDRSPVVMASLVTHLPGTSHHQQQHLERLKAEPPGVCKLLSTKSWQCLPFYLITTSVSSSTVSGRGRGWAGWTQRLRVSTVVTLWLSAQHLGQWCTCRCHHFLVGLLGGWNMAMASVTAHFIFQHGQAMGTNCSVKHLYRHCHEGVL